VLPSVRSVNTINSSQIFSADSNSDTPFSSGLSIVSNKCLSKLSPKSWETENLITSDELNRKKVAEADRPDRRLYPKSHDRYDLAALSKISNKPKYTCTEKAAKKYNIPELGLVNKENIKSQLEVYKSSPSFGGVPGYIDAFFKGEPGGRTEGYALHPEQFCATSFDSRVGGFIISPNQSNIPEKGRSYTDSPSTLLDNTRGNTGFGLVAYWIPPNTYERYPAFQKLFPDTPIPKNAPERESSTSTESNRQERCATQTSNESYKERTGVNYISIPLDLRAEHVPLLEELKEKSLAHLQQVYNCDFTKEKVDIYSHSPFYLRNSCGLHVHIRVNVGQHALEKDLRVVTLDNAIEQLKDLGRIDHFPQTSKGDFVSYAVADLAKANIPFKKIPNVWAAPVLEEIQGRVSVGPEGEKFKELREGRYAVPEKSAKKYDHETIALIDFQNLEKRIKQYENNLIMPNFVHDFLVLPDDIKTQAFLKNPEQFAATAFSERNGGIFIMPNSKYVPGKTETFPDPHNVREATRSSGGFALVGYWVPPSVYEGRPVFNQLFKVDGDLDKSEYVHRETVKEYENRTDISYITNPVDVKKQHLPLLEEFKVLAFNHLSEVYGVKAATDKVDLYLHSPIYGSKTAGLHVHVRVNQEQPAGELDTNALKLDTLISILKDDYIHDEDISGRILNNIRKTNSGKYMLYSPAWGESQFKDVDVSFVKNPWKRPK